MLILREKCFLKILYFQYFVPKVVQKSLDHMLSHRSGMKALFLSEKQG